MKPILFSPHMVTAILSGQKTQTRRVCKEQPSHPKYDKTCYHFEKDKWIGSWCQKIDGKIPFLIDTKGHEFKRPYNKGDLLWIRENWCTSRSLDDVKPSNLVEGAPIQYAAGGTNVRKGYNPHSLFENSQDFCKSLTDPGKGRPSIFMPRWASRLTLQVTDIRLEQLQSISKEDAIAEGIPNSLTTIDDFNLLWCYINGINSWRNNPWVWVTTFKITN